MAMNEEMQARFAAVLDIIDTLPVPEWKKLVQQVLSAGGESIIRRLPGDQKPPGFDSFIEDYSELKEMLRRVADNGPLDVYSRGFWRRLASDSLISSLTPVGIGAYGQVVAAYLMSEIIDMLQNRDESEAERWNDAAYDLHGVDWNAAITQHDRAVAAEPEYPLAWVNKGIALKNQRKHEEAIECYDRAIGIDSEHKKAWYNKGNALSQRGGLSGNAEDLREAISCFEMALRIDPDYELAASAMAKYNSTPYASQKSDAAFLEVVKNDPSLLPLYTKVTEQQDEGNWNEVARLCEQLVQLQPSLPLLWNCWGNALYECGMQREAEAKIDEALKLCPEYASAWSNKARCYIGQGDLEAGLQATHTALKYDSTHSMAWSNQAGIYVMQERWSDALRSAQQGHKVDPSNPYALYHVGIAQSKLGDTRDAKASLERLITLHPAFPGCDVARKMLNWLKSR